MKIGVFGDSFATEEQSKPINESWINVIRQKGYDITTHGVTGTSVWYSYKQFMKHYKKYTHIVFVHSSIHRIHNMPNSLKVYSSYDKDARNRILSSNIDWLSTEDHTVLEKILDVQQYVSDNILDMFICQNVFNTINNIIRNDSQRKIVNLLPFNNRYNDENIDLSNRAGGCVTSLIDVSVKEMPNLFNQTWSDPRSCHLSYENNMALADIVLELFANPGEIVDAIKSSKFVYDNKITKRYYDMAGIKQ